MAEWFDVLTGRALANLVSALAAADRRIDEARRRKELAASAAHSLAVWEARVAELSQQRATLLAEIAQLEEKNSTAMGALMVRCENAISALEAGAAVASAVARLADARSYIGCDLDQPTPAQLLLRLKALEPEILRSRQAIRRQLAAAFVDFDGVSQQLDRQAQLHVQLAELEARQSQLVTVLRGDHQVAQTVLDAIDRLEADHLTQYSQELDVLLGDALIEAGWQLPKNILEEIRQ